MNEKFAAAKKFVSDHKIAIAVVATTAVCFAMHRSAVKDWNKFLDEHSLTDAFYNPED